MFKISVLAFMLCVECVYRVSGASFSKVYLQNGQEVIPLEYIQYGAPAVSIPGPQLAQISAAPVGSLVPVASSHNLINPCGAPCVYPGSAIASVAQTASLTPKITYKANVPAVVENTEGPTSYQYSYVVYDDGTGDHKAQHESSDGSVVRGQYSLLQPDGYVREVHYTADDLKGFNAVVKKFLPANVEAKGESKEEHIPHVPPCHDVNHGSMKRPGHHENHEDRQHHETKNKEIHIETQEAPSRDEVHDKKHGGENHESVKETHSPKELHGKTNEALTKASAGSSTELKSSEESVETQEAYKEHLSEPYHVHEIVADSEHEIHKISETTKHKPKEGPGYQDIIKCIQKSIDRKDQIPTPLTYIVLNNPC